MNEENCLGGLDADGLAGVVRARRVKCSYDLASAIGMVYTPDFDDKVKAVAPGLDCLMRRNDAMSSTRWARKEDMQDMAKEFGAKTVEETMEWAKSGGALHLKRSFLDLEALPTKARNKLLAEYDASPHDSEGVASVKLWKPSARRRVKKEDKVELRAPTGEKLERVKAGTVEGEAMASCVKGKTRDEYAGRDVYIALRKKGMFGDATGVEYTYRCTVVNGIVNQYPVSKVPGKLWTVMDAASTLKSAFTTEKLIGLAMTRMKELGVSCSEEECLAAWEIVRMHQFKKRKDGLCMGYLVEVDGAGWRVRSRNADETSGYFAEVKKRSEGVERKDRVERVDGVEPPTDERPVSVVVETMR